MMTISASGVLHRAADRLEKTRDMQHLAWPLRQLYDHLAEMKRRQDEPGILKEFFGIWSDLDNPSEQP